MHPWTKWAAVGVALGTLVATSAQAQLLISGNDEKETWDATTGKAILQPPGKDTVSIIDISDRTKPRIVASLPMINSVVGPPVNVAITPDQSLALVANSLAFVQDGNAWKAQPDNKLFVIDLTGRRRSRSRPSSSASSRRAWSSTRRAISPSSPTAPTVRSACCRSAART